MTSSEFQIIYYSTSMTPKTMVLPEGTTEEHARGMAEMMANDPYAGFHELREVRTIMTAHSSAKDVG